MKSHLKLIKPHLTASTPPLLQAVGVSKAFPAETGPADVLRDIHLSIESGEFVCLLGPSGCGKTTLLKLFAGFIPPSAGYMIMGGKTVQAPGADRCFVFQEDALFPWLTVAENIAFGLKGVFRNRKNIKAKVDRYLEIMGLSDYRHHLPAEISGGMKQRVALARVLILNPQLLLMDEPFGALDAQTREDMQYLLLSLWKQFARTIIFVTHDINEAILLADRILILSERPGRITTDIRVPLTRPRRTEDNLFHEFYRTIRRMLNR